MLDLERVVNRDLQKKDPEDLVRSAYCSGGPVYIGILMGVFKVWNNSDFVSSVNVVVKHQPSCTVFDILSWARVRSAPIVRHEFREANINDQPSCIFWCESHHWNATVWPSADDVQVSKVSWVTLTYNLWVANCSAFKETCLNAWCYRMFFVGLSLFSITSLQKFASIIIPN